MHMDSGVVSAGGEQQQQQRPAPESATEEREIIEGLIGEVEGGGGGGDSVHCFIDTRWTGYEGESGSSGVRPGPIDNSRLQSSDGGSVECNVVCEAAWKQLEAWYGGGPKVEAMPEQQEPEQLLLTVYVLGNRRKAWRTELQLQVSALTVLARACAYFNLRHEQHYLYNPATRKSIPRDEGVELGDLDLQQETELFVLPKVAEMDSLSSSSLGRVGLENQGNTCYMNSALQVILHCPEIMNYFLLDIYKGHVSRNNPEGSKGKIVEAFADLAKRIWRVGGTGTLSYSTHTRPSRFWEAFSRQYIQFASKAQHDTAEFAEGVLDGLMEDCNRSAIPKIFKVMDDDPLKTDEEMANDNWEYHMCRSDSFITDKFHGQYRAVTTCPSCSFSSRKFESFTILQLGLPQPKTREVNFLLIDVGGNSAPRSMKVDVPGEATVKDVYHVVANLLGENDPEPWTVMALGQKRAEGEVSIKSSDEKLSSFLGFGALVVYCYPSRELGPHSGGVETHFIHQKQAVYTTHFPWPGHQIREKQRFGFPLVVWIPEMSMVDHMRGRSPRKRPHGILEEIFEASLRPAKRKKEDVICLGFHGGADEPVENHVDESGGESNSSRVMGETGGPSMYEMQPKQGNLPSSSACGTLSEAHNLPHHHWTADSGGICRGSGDVTDLPPAQVSNDAAGAEEINVLQGLEGEVSNSKAIGERNVDIERLAPSYMSLMIKNTHDTSHKNESIDKLPQEGNPTITCNQTTKHCHDSQLCQTCTSQELKYEDDTMDTSPPETNLGEGLDFQDDCSNSNDEIHESYTVPCKEKHTGRETKSSPWCMDQEIGTSATEDLGNKTDLVDYCEELSNRRHSRIDLEMVETSHTQRDVINSNESFNETVIDSPSAGLEVSGAQKKMGKEESVLSLAPIVENSIDLPTAGHHIMSGKPVVECSNLPGTKPPSPEISEGTTDAVGGDDGDSVAAQEGDGSGSDYDIGLSSLLDDEERITCPVTYQPYSTHGRSAQTMKLICSSQEGSYDLMEIDDDGNAQYSNPWTRSRKIIVDWTSIGEDIYNLEMLQETVIGHHTTQKNEVHTILECFEHDFSPHPLDKNNLWECGQCKKRVEGIKSMRLWKTPDVLLISLKRFNFSGYRSIKLTPKVQFPLHGLDLSEFCESHDSGNSMVYDLYGVCYHHGDNPKSGHYTSVVRMPDGEWCKFNDSMVHVADKEHDIINSNAYLLCYRRRSASAVNPADILREVLLREDEEQQRRADEQYQNERLAEGEEYGNGNVHSDRYGRTHEYGLGKFADWNSLSDERYSNVLEPNSLRSSDGWGALDAPHDLYLSCSNFGKNENGSNFLPSYQDRPIDDHSDEELIVNGTNQLHPQSDPGETPGM